MTNQILKEDTFVYIQNVLKKSNQNRLLTKILSCIMQSNPDTVKKYTYHINNNEWFVYDGETFKITLNLAHTYHCFFNKLSGFNLRFGTTLDQDPELCELGPEIADIEIVTGSCPKVNSENCRWCYKNNTSAPGKIMTLDEFKTVIESFPKNLSQVALGITGVKSNPYLEDILLYLKSQGIIGNLTLTGADMDDRLCNILASNCGAVAVSCYDKAKDLCYKTIKKLHDVAIKKYGRHMSVNMHIVIADFSIQHVMDVLSDIKSRKVDGLKSVVMLHAKPVGRAKNLDCSLSEENLTKVIQYCLDNDISFGFDSCNGYNVQKILDKLRHSELCSVIEPCESGRLSIYVNVDGKITPCSFVEHTFEKDAIDLLKGNIKVNEIWTTNSMLNSFRNCSKCSKSCPIFKLDC